ncbi:MULTISPECIES: TniQ family protein [unclassified Streptomyces]|nr:MULTISPECIES: TniQ family protein [unclassified Streptomyces]SDR39544.1 regulatory helix-turn-helix protein, lysR family [Streptomyces sp. KS_16]SED05672.1 regulatory helix-turn-helix protein, lysR family [Streptomyces sp. 2133.1]SNC69797.1 regulatory helix-turn-helix protein, lysR family [Streptomyces sp. 2114.4]
MRAPARTLPIRLPPLPGEALDSWLEATARRMDTTLGDVLLHFGFPVRQRAGNQFRGIPADWTIYLDERLTAAVAHATGTVPEAVTAMTLAHYDGRALQLSSEGRAVTRHVLWGRGRGSRFCPDCLHSSGGRWQLSWRLGFSFACTQHRRLLADRCPYCGRVPRQRPCSGRSVPRPELCGNPPIRPGGPVTAGCGADLTRASTLRLPPGHPVLMAQDRVMEIIDRATVAFGPYRAVPQSAPAVLADIRALGIRVLSDLPAEQIPADIAEAHLATDQVSPHTEQAADRPGFMAPPRAVDAAVAVTMALGILEQPGIHPAGEALRGLLEAVREELTQISATSIDDWGRGISPVLQSVHLAALAPSFRPSEHLRYRITTETPRRPTRTTRDIEERASKIPTMFWPSWTVRLTPPEGIHARALAPVLAALLLIPDSRTSLDQAAGLAGDVVDGIETSRLLQELDDLPQWPDIVSALDRLAGHLDTDDTPIDYGRRRRLDYTALLPHDRWLEICRRTGTPPGTGRRERIARSQLFRRLSGLPAESVPDDLGGLDSAEFRATSLRFTALQTPELALALQQEALEFLASHHIHDEPVTWQPPTALLAGLTLPGPDPAHVDLPRLHQLVRQRKHPIQHAAQVLGTTVEAVRHVLDEHPAPPPPLTKNTARATGRIRQQARQAIPEERFTQLYLDEHRSLQQIASLTGFSRRVLTDLAKEYGIPLREGPQDYKRRGTIERAWLIEQYVHRRRTLPDLARETGMSTANMARWAHTYNIPLRPRGGASHHTALRTADEAEALPVILRKALTGPYARKRLSRFLAARPYPTLTEAARALGIHQSTLVVQINRLEADLGQPLFERAERGTAMKLTRFGKRVTSAAQKVPAEEMRQR